MLVAETIAKIRRAYFQDRKPIKQICRELRVSRKTVRKVVRSGATEFTYERSVQPPALRRVQRKLGRVPNGDRQMVDILSVVLTDGLEAVEAACAEALAEGVHSADVILNILARRREPARPATSDRIEPALISSTSGAAPSNPAPPAEPQTTPTTRQISGPVLGAPWSACRKQGVTVGGRRRSGPGASGFGPAGIGRRRRRASAMHVRLSCPARQVGRGRPGSASRPGWRRPGWRSPSRCRRFRWPRRRPGPPPSPSPDSVPRAAAVG